MKKIAEKRRKSGFGAPFVRIRSNRVPSHGSNLILTLQIEWHSPFVAAILRYRDIGSDSEFLGLENHRFDPVAGRIRQSR